MAVAKSLGVVRGVIPLVMDAEQLTTESLIVKAQQMNLIKAPSKVITLLEADQRDYNKTNEMNIVDVL